MRLDPGLAFAAALMLGAPALAALPASAEAAEHLRSPYQVASDLGARGYRVADLRRMGAAYAVAATGPSGNRVLLTVDGRSGEIVGLQVLKWAPGVKPRPAHGARYVDDTYVFGRLAPPKKTAGWTRYRPEEWGRPSEAMLMVDPVEVALAERELEEAAELEAELAEIEAEAFEQEMEAAEAEAEAEAEAAEEAIEAEVEAAVEAAEDDDE